MIVVAMRSNEFDKDDAVIVIHVHDQSIPVAANIANHAVVGYEACMPIPDCRIFPSNSRRSRD